jgi:hypothetical protein
MTKLRFGVLTALLVLLGTYAGTHFEIPVEAQPAVQPTVAGQAYVGSVGAAVATIRFTSDGIERGWPTSSEIRGNIRMRSFRT